MAFRVYRNRQQMIADGWDFSQTGEAKPCRECNEMVEWVISPKKKNISLDAGTCQVHFVHCGAAAPRPASQVPPPPRNNHAQPAEAHMETHSLRESIDELAYSIRTLISELRARRAPAAPPAVEHRVGPDGEPYDKYPRRWNAR